LRRRRLDHAGDGRARLCAAKARVRDGADRARRRAGTADRAEPAPVAGDVRRRVLDLRPPAHRRRAAGLRGRARPPEPVHVRAPRARLARANGACRKGRLVMMRGLSVFVVALLGAMGTPATAQDAYPNRPITMEVPFPPGGVADLTARPVAAAMEKM